MGTSLRPAAAGLILLALLLGGCGGDDDDSPDAAASGTDAEQTDGDPDDGSGPTSAPAPEQLTSERVAEVDPIRVTTATGVDGGFVTLVSGTDSDGFTTTSMVRIDADGTTSTPVALPEGTSVPTLFRTSAGTFAAASTYAGETRACGYAPLDPETLALGAIVSTSPDPSSCSIGTPTTVDGAVAIFTSDGAVTFADTESGEVRHTPTTDFPQHQPRTVVPYEGDHYAVLGAGWDSESGETITAEDGSALPDVLLRIDGASGEVGASAEVPTNSNLTVGDDGLVVVSYPEADETSAGDPEIATIDPETLELEEAGDDAQAGACRTSRTGREVEVGGLVWAPGIRDEVYASEAGGCTTAAVATLTSLDLPEDVATNTFLTSNGDDLIVLRVVNDQTDFEAPPSLIAIDRVAAG